MTVDGKTMMHAVSNLRPGYHQDINILGSGGNHEAGVLVLEWHYVWEIDPSQVYWWSDWRDMSNGANGLQWRWAAGDGGSCTIQYRDTGSHGSARWNATIAYTMANPDIGSDTTPQNIKYVAARANPDSIAPTCLYVQDVRAAWLKP
jgi:hypothetical protein